MATGRIRDKCLNLAAGDRETMPSGHITQAPYGIGWGLSYLVPETSGGRSPPIRRRGRRAAAGETTENGTRGGAGRRRRNGRRLEGEAWEPAAREGLERRAAGAVSESGCAGDPAPRMRLGAGSDLVPQERPWQRAPRPGRRGGSLPSPGRPLQNSPRARMCSRVLIPLLGERVRVRGLPRNQPGVPQRSLKGEGKNGGSLMGYSRTGGLLGLGGRPEDPSSPDRVPRIGSGAGWGRLQPSLPGDRPLQNAPRPRMCRRVLIPLPGERVGVRGLPLATSPPQQRSGAHLPISDTPS